MIDSCDQEALLKAVLADIGETTVRRSRPDGYPGEIEAAIVDSICSVRTRYGSPTTGVRRHVASWRAFRSAELLDDVQELSYFAKWNAGRSDRPIRQKISGHLKANLISDVAAGLKNAHIRTAADLLNNQEAAELAWCSVHGLGWTTWQYVRLLLLEPAVKPDTLLTRYVARAVGRQLSSRDVVETVLAASRALDVDPRSLDHAIWSWERSRV